MRGLRDLDLAADPSYWRAFSGLPKCHGYLVLHVPTALLNRSARLALYGFGTTERHRLNASRCDPKIGKKTGSHAHAI